MCIDDYNKNYFLSNTVCGLTKSIIRVHLYKRIFKVYIDVFPYMASKSLSVVIEEKTDKRV